MLTSVDEVIAEAVSRLRSTTNASLAFGGAVHTDSAVVSRVEGGIGTRLDGLRVAAGRGLGGLALAEQRPRLATEYASSKNITHDYDEEVLSEGITTLLALPVVVDATPRAMLYVGLRAGGSAGSEFARRAARVADETASAVRALDERAAAVRLAGPSPITAATSVESETRQRERVREAYAELRLVADATSDPELRSRLRRIAGLLSSAPDTLAEAPPIHLSPRELDVVAQMAMGRTNREAAASLGLTEATVKSYASTLMSKLESGTRLAAVTTARRHGIIP